MLVLFSTVHVISLSTYFLYGGKRTIILLICFSWSFLGMFVAGDQGRQMLKAIGRCFTRVSLMCSA